VRAGRPPRLPRSPPCPSPKTRSSRPSARRGPRAAPQHRRPRHGARHRHRRRAVAGQVALTVAGCPLRNEITNRVTGRSALDGVDRVDVDFTVMTDEERAALRQIAPRRPGGHRRQPARPRPRRGPGSPSPTRRAPRVLLIASGKGGVGKSSVTTNLAWRWPSGARRSAIIDADVWGFSIPDARRRPPAGGDRLDAGAARGPRGAGASRWASSPGGPAGHLAGADAAQGARAVPHRRLLGRPRLPARRPAARHRRHRHLAGPVPAAGRGVRGHHAPAGAAGRPAGRRSWPRR
jgi:Mrp family chromosome partitioning ATPase